MQRERRDRQARTNRGDGLHGGPERDIRSRQSPDRSEESDSGLTRRTAMGGALGLILAGAGAAAGVTMDGNVVGDVSSKVDKAVVVSDAIVFAFNNGLGNVSDDGTRFRTGANINQGDPYVVQLELDNNSDQGRTERLALDVPEQLEVEVDADTTTGAEVARDQKGRWLVKLDDSLGQIVEITVAAPDAIMPGFYEITGKLSPLDFDSGGNGGS